MRLALHIICRDEFDQVLRLIKSYGMFDEYAVAVDDELTFKKLKTYFSNEQKANISLYEWDDEEKALNFPKFDKKRNFLAEKTQSEYYLRLDTDDFIERPENVRPLFDKAVQNNMDVINVQYVYSRDMDGNTTSVHWRETIIRKDPNQYWKKNIHENIFVEDQSKVRVVRDNTIRIIHDITEEHIVKSSERNIKFLLAEYEKDKEATDPRTLAYLGRMFMGVGKWSQSVFFLHKLIEKSGWQDDVYFAWLDMANCFQQLVDYKQALACCNEALEIRTDWNLAYHVKAEIYLAGNDFDKCIDWAMVGFTKGNPDTEGVYDPTRTSYRALMNIALALLHKGDVDIAKKYYDKAFKMAPSNEFIASNQKTFEEAYEKEQYLKKFIDVFNFTVHKDRAKAEKLIDSIPDVMMTDMRIHAIRNKIIHPKEWADNEIAIYCGQAWEDWGPPSVHRGIGGSEEAVINISQELTRLGYKVTVFNTCGDLAGEYNGVLYKPYYSINPKDKFNIVIAWRNDIFSGFPIEAKKKIVWLHDVPMQGQFKPPYGFDKIIVLSQFHKTLLPKDVPDEKIFVSTNGINVKDFDGLFDRNPKRCIYTSSYDRGLETLLRIWPDVIKEVPEAELHIFYGWNLYDEMIASGVRSKAFKDMMLELMKQKGVHENGRIGHKRLAQEFLKSGVYAYPCHFEEISCCVGDTPILMPRDHIKHPSGVPIKDLVGKSGFHVYSYDHETNRIVLGVVNKVWKARENAEVLRITLDDGKVLRFTPEHLFLMRDGSWKRAEHLQSGDSLMPCYERPTFAIKQTTGDWEMEHRMLGEAMFGDISGMHIDHKDGNRYNNTPDNIIAISPQDHAKKSLSKDRRYISVSGRKRIKDASSESVRNRFTSDQRTEWAKKQCRNMWDKVRSMPIDQRSAWLKERHEKKLLTIAKKNGFNSFEEFRRSKKNIQEAYFNHKVIGVEVDGHREDVYDMEVEKYHNFSANEIFVHNCISAMKAQAAGCVPVVTDYAALNETVKEGVKVHGKENVKEFKEKLIEVLKDEKGQEEIRQKVLLHKGSFGWDKVAESWRDNLFG